MRVTRTIRKGCGRREGSAGGGGRTDATKKTKKNGRVRFTFNAD